MIRILRMAITRLLMRAAMVTCVYHSTYDQLSRAVEWECNDR